MHPACAQGESEKSGFLVHLAPAGKGITGGMHFAIISWGVAVLPLHVCRSMVNLFFQSPAPHEHLCRG